MVEKKERVSELCERKAGSNLDRTCKQKQTAVGVTFDTFDRKHDLSPSGNDNVFIKRTGTKKKKLSREAEKWSATEFSVLLEKKTKVIFFKYKQSTSIIRVHRTFLFDVENTIH